MKGGSRKVPKVDEKSICMFGWWVGDSPDAPLAVEQLWDYQQQDVVSKKKRPARGVSPEMLSLEEQYVIW